MNDTEWKGMTTAQKMVSDAVYSFVLSHFYLWKDVKAQIWQIWFDKVSFSLTIVYSVGKLV